MTDSLDLPCGRKRRVKTRGRLSEGRFPRDNHRAAAEIMEARRVVPAMKRDLL